MRRCSLLLLLWLLLSPPVHADWKELREGMDARTVLQAIGRPLISTRGRGGLYETWTYDCGGFVMFVRGALRTWQPPAAGRNSPPRGE